MWKLLLGLGLGYLFYADDSYSKPKPKTKPKNDDYKIPDAELEKQVDEIIFKDKVEEPEPSPYPDLEEQLEDIEWQDLDLEDILAESGYTPEEIEEMMTSLES